MARSGLGVAVVHDYRIEWSRGFGLRDEAAQLRVDASTPLQAASVSHTGGLVGPSLQRPIR